MRANLGLAQRDAMHIADYMAIGGGKRGRSIHVRKPEYNKPSTDDDRANERPDKYFGPSAASGQGANKVASDPAEHCADYSRD